MLIYPSSSSTVAISPADRDDQTRTDIQYQYQNNNYYENEYKIAPLEIFPHRQEMREINNENRRARNNVIIMPVEVRVARREKRRGMYSQERR